MWDSIIGVLSGPLLAKLVLAAALVAVFVFLRKKDTEGAMTGYAFIACFLAVRDILFVFVADQRLYDISDLVLFGGLLFVSLKPFRLGWPYWVRVALDGRASCILVLEALGLNLGILADNLRLVALVPIADPRPRSPPFI